MVTTRSSFEDSTTTTSPVTTSPVDWPPREVEVNVGTVDSKDDASVASAPVNPLSVAQGLGARFRNARNGPTPKKVAFDTVAWLTQKALGSREGSQGAGS